MVSSALGYDLIVYRISAKRLYVSVDILETPLLPRRLKSQAQTTIKRLGIVPGLPSHPALVALDES
jgi:hypothetical protein